LNNAWLIMRPSPLRFVALQSPLGRDLLQACGRAADDLSSMVVVEEGRRAYLKVQLPGTGCQLCVGGGPESTKYDTRSVGVLAWAARRRGLTRLLLLLALCAVRRGHSHSQGNSPLAGTGRNVIRSGDLADPTIAPRPCIRSCECQFQSCPTKPTADSSVTRVSVNTRSPQIDTAFWESDKIAAFPTMMTTAGYNLIARGLVRANPSVDTDTKLVGASSSVYPPSYVQGKRSFFSHQAVADDPRDDVIKLMGPPSIRAWLRGVRRAMSPADIHRRPRTDRMACSWISPPGPGVCRGELPRAT
jgi:hypothetical protein